MANRRSFLMGTASLAAGLAFRRNAFAQELAKATSGSPEKQIDIASQDVEGLWQSDRRVYVQNISKDEMTGYRIVGDIVELSDESFPSLVRPDGGVLSGRTTLIIEARELVIDMAIRLDDATFLASADKVSFGPNGQISLTLPSEAYSQRIEIIARELTFIGGRRLPLEFKLAAEHRSVSLIAVNFVDREGKIETSADACFDLIRNASLSYHTVDLPNGSPDQPIVLLDEDASRYQDAIAKAHWPEATALKLRRFFAKGPYKADIQDFILGKIAILNPIFKAQQSGLAEAEADDLVRAINSRTDSLGLLESAVPMSSLGERLSRFKELLNREFGESGTAGTAAAWDALSIAASLSGAVNISAIDSASKELESQSEKIAELGKERLRIKAALTLIEDDIASKNAQISAHEAYIKQQIAAKAYHQANQGVAIGVQIIAAVGSVAFPAAAPFLIAASAVVSAIDAINRNDGDLLSKVTDVAEIVQNHIAIMNHAREVRSQWDKVDSGFGVAKQYAFGKTALTDAEKKAFESWKEAVQKMKGEATSLYEILSKQAATAEVKFDDNQIKNDPEMVVLFNKRNELVAAQTHELERLAVALKSYDAATAAVLKTTALLAELQKLDLTNDLGNMRVKQLADWVRSDIAHDFARESELLRRSVRYATGRDLGLPEDVVFFPEGDDEEQATFVMTDPGKLEEVLKRRRTERFANFGLILYAARKASDAAKDATAWNVPVPIAFTAHMTTNFGDEAVQAQKRDFVRILNRLLGDAIRTGAPSQTAPIPFSPGPIGATENAILAGINVSDLSFSAGREPNSEFILAIRHPRIGEIFREGSALVYSDAAINAQGESEVVLPASSKRFSLPRDVHGDWKTDLAQDVLLSTIHDFDLPLLAPYEILVEIANRGDWSEAPEIEGIRIDFVAMNPR